MTSLVSTQVYRGIGDVFDEHIAHSHMACALGTSLEVRPRVVRVTADTVVDLGRRVERILTRFANAHDLMQVAFAVQDLGDALDGAWTLHVHMAGRRANGTIVVMDEEIHDWLFHDHDDEPAARVPPPTVPRTITSTRVDASGIVEIQRGATALEVFATRDRSTIEVTWLVDRSAPMVQREVIWRCPHIDPTATIPVDAVFLGSVVLVVPNGPTLHIFVLPEVAHGA